MMNGMAGNILPSILVTFIIDCAILCDLGKEWVF